MNNNISILIFTCKRALQLDLLLESIFKNFKNINYPIYIVCDYRKSHSKSYEAIKKKWLNKINFFLINSKKKIKNKRYLYFRPLNIYHILRWRFLGCSNFKTVLEKILQHRVKTDFVTMMTDDAVVFDKTFISNSILKIINKQPNKYFYRYCLDRNFLGLESIKNCKSLKYCSKKKIYMWKLKNNFFNFYNYFWNYRFSIDASIFKKSSLLELIKPIFYHNPTTLESNANKESYFRGYYEYGISNLKRTYAGLQLNNVQKMIDTPAAKFDIEFLQKLYVAGYRLYCSKKIFNKKIHNVIPKNIFLKKNKIKYNYLKLFNEFKKDKNKKN